MTRRGFLAGAAAIAAAGCSSSSSAPPASSAASAPVLHCPQATGDALWSTAARRGLVYGSSTATWQIADHAYRALYERESAMLFTEDDLLWWRLRPHPGAELDFSYADRIVRFAERNGMLVFGAHLVWDEGYGDGWQQEDFYGIDPDTASRLLFGTVSRTVSRYRGRVTAWSVANEVLDGGGLRADVPWYQTIGPDYVARAFRVAHAADPGAVLVLNDFGFEVDDDFAVAADKRRAALDLIDAFRHQRVPIHALGVQAHLNAETFYGFDPAGYGTFLADVADRGLHIFITELDVLDDGLPADQSTRDSAIADVYTRYLHTALAQPAVSAVMTFGLSDRYTWLQEDEPRHDGAQRRPLPFDVHLDRKPAYSSLHTMLADARVRSLAWQPPRCA